MRTLVFLCLFILSCRPPPKNETRVILEPDVELLESVESIAKCINDEAGTTLVALGKGEHAVRVIYSIDEDPKICGRYFKNTRLIHVDPNSKRCPIGIVLAHEIGHSMGFSHVEDENDIMFPKIRISSMPEACSSLVARLNL